MSRFDCPYFNAPAFLCAVFHSRSSVSDATGADGPSDESHALKSRFIPYLNVIEQFSSLPRALAAPEQIGHNE
jgi:hypothetical protein